MLIIQLLIEVINKANKAHTQTYNEPLSLNAKCDINSTNCQTELASYRISMRLVLYASHLFLCPALRHATIYTPLKLCVCVGCGLQMPTDYRVSASSECRLRGLNDSECSCSIRLHFR